MAMSRRKITVCHFAGEPSVGTLLPIRKGMRLLRFAALGTCISLALATAAMAQPPRPFSISVDGVPVAGAGSDKAAAGASAETQGEVDVQVKFDGLDAKPILNVSTVPPRRSFAPGEDIAFLASSNYPDWIERLEIRIFAESAGTAGKPLEIVPVDGDGHANWLMPEEGPEELFYVLRVYGADGAFDETEPLSLLRSSKKLATHNPSEAPAAGAGEDRTAIRNIDVHGGSVTVYGRNVPRHHRVVIFGTEVPVDGGGSFVTQRILPPGDHEVSVEVEDGDGQGLSFARDVHIPDNEWFYVGMADFTAGSRSGSDGIEDVKPGEFDSIYTRGRAAFYLKGKIKGRYLLTASADTREGPLEETFQGLDGKDPRQFLRRIDPESYYPVYGDDSTAVEDAPTRGKFYVRLERGDSHVMWGNFKADVTGTEFLRNNRALYGAAAAYRPAPVTSFGVRKTNVTAYISQPGTLPQRDVLRGTGGSAYFLKHQDITRGSETISVEVRDRITGRVLERTALQYGTDYDISYVQGVVVLKKPLHTTTASGSAVDSGGNPIYVVADYEYTPATEDVDGYTFGGRAQQWLGDHLRLGVTGMSEKTGSADQRLAGADLLIRHSEGTYLEAEVANSTGPGFGTSYSQNGGLDILEIADAGRKGRSANAYRLRGKADLGELTAGEFLGSLEAFIEDYEKHFSSPERLSAGGETTWGLKGDLELGSAGTLAARYAERRSSEGDREREAIGEAKLKLDENWSVTPGVTYSESHGTGRDGKGDRLDAGARLTYRWSEKQSAYLRGQGTVAKSGRRDRNDRVGVGGEMPLTDKVSLAAEVSIGSTGPGALVTLDYAPSADDHYYVGYRLDPREESALSGISPVDDDLGAIVAGAKRRLSQEVSAFAESRSTPWADSPSLIHTYGVTYTPDSRWTLTGGIEQGLVFGDSFVDGTSDIDRTAVSARATYASEDRVRATLGAEFRNDDEKDGPDDTVSYLLTGGLRYSVSDDWRFMLQADAAFTDASSTALDGDYAEASAGFAYRPVDNDRLNALFRYTYLYDLPGADQVTFDGSTDSPQQESHILSADLSYDLIPQLTIGAKYGLRHSRTRDRDGTGGWEDSIAQLGIVRADIHIVHSWDILIEGRVLATGSVDTVDYGLLAGVFRHVGENLKVGGGYNFGRFSDDLRDQTLDDQGWFINVLAKF